MLIKTIKSHAIKEFDDSFLSLWFIPILIVLYIQPSKLNIVLEDRVAKSTKQHFEVLTFEWEKLLIERK